MKDAYGSPGSGPVCIPPVHSAPTFLQLETRPIGGGKRTDAFNQHACNGDMQFIGRDQPIVLIMLCCSAQNLTYYAQYVETVLLEYIHFIIQYLTW